MAAGLQFVLFFILFTSSGYPIKAAELYLKDDRPFCDNYNCAKLLPQAETYQRSKSTSLPVIEALIGGEVIAYLFLSTDLVNIPAYSGKPLVTLIAIDPKGTILGASVLHHAEPILLVGIPESVLDEYLAWYVGRNIAEHLEGGGGQSAVTTTPSGDVHMITGATVTALVLEETLLTSAREVGRSLNILPAEEQRQITWKADYTPKTWEELVAEGSVGHLRVEAKEMDPTADGTKPWIDLYFGDVTQPITGINILGKQTYNWATNRMEPGDRLFFIVANGLSSFKGSGFVRGGIYDRFHFIQDLNKFSFRDLDYENLYGVNAKGAPKFQESGLFFLKDKRLDPTLPWEFFYLASRLTGETATSKVFHNYIATYHFPEKYYDVVRTRSPRRATLTERIWIDQGFEASQLALFLIIVMVIFWKRNWITRSAKRLEWIHIGVLLLSVIVLGLWMKTPPSVTQIFPLLQVFAEDFRPGLFLADPLLFVFWIAIAISLIFWGRGWFCGWVCPYGALLELWYKVTHRILPKKWLFEFSEPTHNILRRVRYVILAALLLISIFSLEWAERLAEVEPFKTTWLVGVFNREFLFSGYWWAIFIFSAFNFRFYCRYVCPLGAALSVGSLFQRIPIKRKDYCTKCKICRRGCESRAINLEGQINRFECLSCFECEQKYDDDQICPPLIIARRVEEKAKAGDNQP